MDEIQHAALMKLLGQIHDELQRITRSAESSQHLNEKQYAEWTATQARQEARHAVPVRGVPRATPPGPVPAKGTSDYDDYLSGVREGMEEALKAGAPPEIVAQALKVTGILGSALFPPNHPLHDVGAEVAQTAEDQCETRARKSDGPGYTCCQLKRGHVGFCRSLGGSVLNQVPGFLGGTDPARTAEAAGEPEPVPATNCGGCGVEFSKDGTGWTPMPDFSRMCYKCGERTAPPDIEGAPTPSRESAGDVIEEAADFVRTAIGPELADKVAAAIPVVLSGGVPRCKTVADGKRCLLDQGHEGTCNGGRGGQRVTTSVRMGDPVEQCGEAHPDQPGVTCHRIRGACATASEEHPHGFHEMLHDDDESMDVVWPIREPA